MSSGSCGFFYRALGCWKLKWRRKKARETRKEGSADKLEEP